MAEDTRDVLMRMELPTGKLIDAECQALIDHDDDLAKDFVKYEKPKGGTGEGYFSIEDFTFNVALAGDTNIKDGLTASKENAKQMLEEQAKKQKAAFQQALEDVAGDRKGKIPKLPDAKIGGSRDSTAFARFMSVGRSAMRAQTYPADLEEIQITKQMDASSMALYSACLACTTFKKVALIKRRAVGNKQLLSYMRIDFTDVMITELGWDDDEVVKERFKFVCRGAAVQYIVQLDDARKKGAKTSGQWSVLSNGSAKPGDF